MSKIKLFSRLTILTFTTLLFLSNAFSQDASLKNTVRIIYFYANDRQPQQDIDTKLDTMIKRSQKFFADQMASHGFGRKTFRFETDESGNAVVHHFRGKFPDAHYQRSANKAFGELPKYINNHNVYIIVLDMSVRICGVAVIRTPFRGIAALPAYGGCFNYKMISHELGHTFGLDHDFRDNAYIMSYGGNPNRLSRCAAEFLAVHPYFNTHTDVSNHRSVIELHSLQEVPPDTLLLRFQVADANGLHQLQMFGSEGTVYDCKSLKGESAIVEFATTGITVHRRKGVLLKLMDAAGNYTSKRVSVPEHTFPGPKIEGPWLWAVVPTGEKGEIAAASGIDYLSLASGGAVTERKIATRGATQGTSVGKSRWTSAKISSSGGNNITEMVNAVNLAVGDVSHHAAYGSITLMSPQQQQTTMYVGSDDAVKVWLNGTLVHKNPIERGAKYYQDAFPVTLKRGKNVLLVAVYQGGGAWSGFFGFKGNAKYDILNPDGTLILGPRISGPKITGPWLWMITRTSVPGGAAAAKSGTDYLAAASNGKTSELKVATDGVASGEEVGNRQWTSAEISADGHNNITKTVNAANLGVGTINNHVAYGYIALDSPKKQQTTMYAGSDDAVKVWLNGTLAHDNPINRRASDYKDEFPVTLKKGTNHLLVAVYQKGGDWSGFFGFDYRAEYTVRPYRIAKPIQTPGPKITGPWLWMLAPTMGRGGAAAAKSGIDYLAAASSGKTSELKVATDGAAVGEPVGNKKWTPAEISPSVGNNITTLMNDTGLGGGDINNHVAYGYIALDSLKELETTMYIGSDDAIKVWLNGMLIHNNPVNRGANDYQDKFPVTLKKGTNHLLVAVYERRGRWAGYFGLAKQAEYTVLPHRIYTSEPAQFKEDVNGDGTVNIQDLVLIASNLGQTGENNTDVNEDSIVNIRDLVLVAGALGTSAAAPSLLHPVTLEMFTSTDVRQWLSQAQQLILTDPTSLQGILFLEQLLAVLIPKETALLVNYPNPFNPETWIPYQLSKPADVTLTIYAVNGQVVRTLTLGHQPAGIYQTRSRAAHWDGRNAFGEPVAGGVYFYTLTAGGFSATRKMLIRK